MRIIDLEQGQTFSFEGDPRVFTRLEQSGEHVRVLREDRGVTYLLADLEVAAEPVVEEPSAGVVEEATVVKKGNWKGRRDSKGRYIANRTDS